ncbi:hypothetical protein BDW02DRAFT_559068 [Decorospora gaudefroyi]|uniref:XPA C-terminal domain-containing protein n=1 Tax=Decorospora gaudefroyi TaxID=184978 RepID=A0A6A5K271_9PLEO|nr:hypothetical protein BDW02DRAFT_559068 [Decorospora gaudefroyi]
MSTRRSSRSTKAVKYTSASEGSDFEDKPKRLSKKTASSAATTKKTSKAAKRAAEADDAEPTGSTNLPPAKRPKKNSSTSVSAEARSKTSAQEARASKAAHKKAWADWLASHDVEGELLEVEPEKEESITQTDALKKYGLKKEELSSLLHFEKKNPLYGGTMKLFLEDDVKELGFRKLGMLADGEADEEEEEVLKRGQRIWEEEHKDDPQKPDKPTKEKTPKQKWTQYITAHALTTNDTLSQEPQDAVNQTDSKAKYNLTPTDLACLPYFAKKNPAYGNGMKLFKESEVRVLAYRKAAVLAGEGGGDEGAFLERGREIFEGGGEGGE